MRPRWGLGFALLAVAAAVLLPVPSSGAGSALLLHDDDKTCKRSWTAYRCATEHYTEVDPWDSGNLTSWKKLLEGASWQTDANCQKVKGWALDAIGRADGSITGGNRMYIYWGVPKENGTSTGGSSGVGLNNGKEDMIVVNDTLDRQPGALKWRAFLHEAGHIGGLGHSGSFTAYDAEECAEISNEEEDPGAGGGTEDDPDDPGDNCTTMTIWVEDWVSCPDSPTCNPSCLLEACIRRTYVPVEITICGN